MTVYTGVVIKREFSVDRKRDAFQGFVSSFMSFHIIEVKMCISEKVVMLSHLAFIGCSFIFTEKSLISTYPPVITK